MLGSSNHQLSHQNSTKSELEQLKLLSPNSKKLAPRSIVAEHYEVVSFLDIDKSVVAYLVNDRRDQEDSLYVLELVFCSSESINHERCQEKIKWLKRLSTHVQIPKLYDYVVFENQCFLVYEYVEGKTLATLLHHQKLNEAEIVGLLQDLARIYDFLIKGNILDYNFIPHNFLRSNANERYILSNLQGLFTVKKSSSPLTIQQQKLLWCHHLKICGQFLIQFLIGNYSPQLGHGKNIAFDWKKRINLSPHGQSILGKMIAREEGNHFNSLQEIMAECQPLLKIQQSIGDKYRLIRYLGDQNNLKTYIASDLNQQSSGSVFLIIKQISIYDDDTENFNKKLQQVQLEVDRTRKLDLIPEMELIQEVNDDEQELYLVRGYCQGISLTKKLTQNTEFLIAEILDLLAKSLKSLVAIHEHNLIHQNIKPSNLIIAGNEDPIIFVDMGILNNFLSSKNIAQNADSYKPPEQLIGRPTQSSDIYALGMVIIQVLKTLSWSESSSPIAVENLVWQEKLKTNDCSWLVPILEKMVHTDVANRYQSSWEVERDLELKSVHQPEESISLSKDSPKNSTAFAWLPLRKLASWKKNTMAVVALILCSFGALELLMPTIRPKYWTSQGYQQLSYAQPEKALANFETALNLKPQKTDTLLGKANALSQLQHFSPALSIYRQLLATNQSDVTSLLGRGNIHFDLGNYTEALNDYNQVLKSQPDQPHALARKGKILHSLSRYREAFTVQKKALAIESNNNVSLLSDAANTALALGKNHRALNQFTRVENIAPLQPYLWQNKVRVLQNQERFEEALKHSYTVLENYEQALQKEPQNLQLRLGQGKFFLQLQRDRMASKAYQSAIAIDPNSDAAWLGLGEVFLNNKKYTEALAAVEKAIILNPESFQAWHTKGLILQQSQQDLEQALVSYNRAIDLNRYYFPAWRDRSFVLLAQEDYEQAIKSLKKSVKIAPQDLKSWLQLSVAFQKVPNLEGSVNAMNRVIALQPRNSDYWLQKGSLIELQKQGAQACNLYRQAMAVAPNLKITEAIERLGCDQKN